MNQAVNQDQILPQNEYLGHRLDKDNVYKWLKRDIEGLYGYSSKPKERNVCRRCSRILLGAVIKSAKGPKHAGSKEVRTQSMKHFNCKKFIRGFVQSPRIYHNLLQDGNSICLK
jgi:hypothetical protein